MDGELLAKASVLYTDRELLDRTLESKADVVAIDAPLALPRGRESLDLKSNIHFRACDHELRRRGIKFFPVTLGPMRKLTERGIRLRASLESAGMKVMETYPGAAQDILGIPRKGRGLNRLAEGLCLQHVRGIDRRMSGDELDAITCALAGIAYLKGDFLALGDPSEILMILPGAGPAIRSEL